MLKTFTMPLGEIVKSDRLDPPYFSPVVRNHHLRIDQMMAQGVIVPVISDIADCYWPGRIKRINARISTGKPFLTAKQVFLETSTEVKYCHDSDSRLELPEECILITRSGTLGRSIPAYDHLDEKVIADDLVRVSEPKSDCSQEYMYAYFNTTMGRDLLTRETNGSVVDHIDDKDVGRVKIPLLPIHDDVTDKISAVNKLRNAGIEQCNQARKLLADKLELSSLEYDYDKKLHKAGDTITFSIPATDLQYGRLDPPYYHPLVTKALKELNDSASRVLALSEVAEVSTPPRFKRQDVESVEFGVPRMSGKHLGSLKFDRVKYCSHRMRNLHKYLLKEDTILLSASGTIGRISLVGPNREGWSADNHVARVNVKKGYHPGYISCYLESRHAQILMKRGMYGSVVDEIGEVPDQLLRMKVPIPKEEGLQEQIGELYRAGQHKLEKAIKLEDEAITVLEKAISAYPVKDTK